MQEIGENNLNQIALDIKVMESRLLGKVDKDFEGLCRVINSTSKSFHMPEFETRKITPLTYDHDDTITVLFSGGNVSLATAVRLISMGKKINLVYFNVNGKVDRISEMAKVLKVPFIVSKYNYTTKVLSGVKMLHRAMMLAVENHHAPIIYTGFFDFASIYNNDVKDWCYCNEVIEPYAKVIGRYVEGARVINLLPNYAAVEDELSIYRKKYLKQ